MMSAPTFDTLITEWRARAKALERYGDPTCARLWALAADELAHALAASDAAPLSVTDAARRTGYTADHLRALITRGVIPNAGRKNAPLIRVGDLPAPKPARGPGRPRRPRLVPSPHGRLSAPNKPEVTP